MSAASKINDTFPLIVEMLISLCLPHHLIPIYPAPTSTLRTFFYLSLPPSSNETFDQGDTVSLDDSKKFKIININQATFLDGPGNKFEHKAQLIEIDKLLINTSSGPKQNKASLRIGVWHQVSSLFSSFIFPFRHPRQKLFPAFASRT